MTSGSNSSDADALAAIVDELLATLAHSEQGKSAGAVLRLAMAVASQPHFQSLVDSYPDLAERLSTARDQVLESVPALASPATAPPPELAENGFLCSLKTVGHANVWIGEPQSLMPAVQLVLTDQRGERVFDQVVDWSDLLFLGESSLAILKDSLAAGVTLVSREISGEFLASLPQATDKLRALLQELADAAAAYEVE